MVLSLMAGLVVTPAMTHADSDAAVAERTVRAVLSGAAATDVELWDLSRCRDQLAELYAQRAFAPYWFSQGQLTEAGSVLLQQLNDVESRGLLADDYDGDLLARRAAELAGRQPASVQAIARLDVALSAAAARLAADLHSGRIRPAEVGYDLDIPQPAFDACQAVTTLAASPALEKALDAMEPQLRHYLLLKTALAKYRALAMHPDLTHLPALPGSSVRPGETYSGAAALRGLLWALGDLHAPLNDAGVEAQALDPALVTALAHFQYRHGLEADGVLGRSTFRALTTPFDARIGQIVLSLERVRWLPPKLESPPIIVNIPQFRLFAFRTTGDDARDILQMDVIVGSTFKARRTPVFAADMRYIVLQPYWDVPYSIMAGELLPQIKADPAWVADNGYEIVRGQGDDAPPLPVTAENIELLERGKLRLRQKPGPANALGHVKFMFPNRHNVYLHDTPARSLFSRSRRAFSHGCIRVAEPMALVAHVMRDDPTWNADRLAAALRGKTPVRVPLRKPIRVFILYGTALATEAGDTLFFDDIYDQDARLTGLLSARRKHAIAPPRRTTH